MNLLEKVNFKIVYFNVFMHLYMYLGTYIIHYTDHNVWTERFLKYKPTFFIFSWVMGGNVSPPNMTKLGYLAASTYYVVFRNSSF